MEGTRHASSLQELGAASMQNNKRPLLWECHIFRSNQIRVHTGHCITLSVSYKSNTAYKFKLW